MKSRKALISGVLLIVLAICMTLCLIACNEDTVPALSAPEISLSGNVISWAAVENAVGYEVYENEVKKAELDAEATSYTIVDPYDGGTYSYQVKALAGAGFTDSALSEAVSFVASTKIVLGKPEAAIELTAEGYILGWDAIEHAAGYEVYQGATKVADVEEESYKIEVAADGAYSYSVKAKGDATYADSASSDAVVFIQKSLVADRVYDYAHSEEMGDYAIGTAHFDIELGDVATNKYYNIAMTLGESAFKNGDEIVEGEEARISSITVFGEKFDRDKDNEGTLENIQLTHHSSDPEKYATAHDPWIGEIVVAEAATPAISCSFMFDNDNDLDHADFKVVLYSSDREYVPPTPEEPEDPDDDGPVGDDNYVLSPGLSFSANLEAQGSIEITLENVQFGTPAKISLMTDMGGDDLSNAQIYFAPSGFGDDMQQLTWNGMLLQLTFTPESNTIYIFNNDNTQYNNVTFILAQEVEEEEQYLGVGYENSIDVTIPAGEAYAVWLDYDSVKTNTLYGLMITVNSVMDDYSGLTLSYATSSFALEQGYFEAIDSMLSGSYQCDITFSDLELFIMTNSDVPISVNIALVAKSGAGGGEEEDAKLGLGEMFSINTVVESSGCAEITLYDSIEFGVPYTLIVSPLNYSFPDYFIVFTSDDDFVGTQLEMVETGMEPYYQGTVIFTQSTFKIFADEDNNTENITIHAVLNEAGYEAPNQELGVSAEPTNITLSENSTTVVDLVDVEAGAYTLTFQSLLLSEYDTINVQVGGNSYIMNYGNSFSIQIEIAPDVTSISFEYQGLVSCSVEATLVAVA